LLEAIIPSRRDKPTESHFVFAARSAAAGKSTMTLIFVFVGTMGRISTFFSSPSPSNIFPEGAPEVEGNPMLGDHGIRSSLKHPEILKAEFQAIKNIAEKKPRQKN